MMTTTTLPSRARAIDPKLFLDFFTACGGGYCFTPDGQLWLGVLESDINPDRDIAAQILREVKPSDVARIKAYLIAREKGESQIADDWSNALVKFKIAESDYRTCTSQDVIDEDEADRLCSIESDARWDMIRMPAPDRPALLWKLDYLLQGSNGTLDPYNTADLAQTVADCRRLLVEVCPMSPNAPKAVAAYYAAEQAHEDNRLDGDGYIAALHRLDDWQPASPIDFVHKFIALHHDGNSPSYDRLQKLIEQALQIVRADVERLAVVSRDPAQWDAAMQARQKAAGAFAAHEAIAPGSDALDALCNAVTDAEDTLFNTDAPHTEAALWKLDLLEQEAAASSITPQQIRRVSTDIRRLIGEA